MLTSKEYNEIFDFLKFGNKSYNDFNLPQEDKIIKVDDVLNLLQNYVADDTRQDI
jgi:hypothetical protein